MVKDIAIPVGYRPSISDVSTLNKNLNDLKKYTPLYRDRYRVKFFLTALKMIREIDINSITPDIAYFHALYKGVWTCPKDNETINKYLKDNLFTIKLDISLAILTMFNYIKDSIVGDPDTYGGYGNGTTIGISESTQEKILELKSDKFNYTKHDLYLKYLSLHDNSYVEHKRFFKIEEKDLVYKNKDHLFKYVMDISNIQDVFLKGCYQINKQYDLEQKPFELVKDCTKEELRTSILSLEALLLLIDTTSGTSYSEIFEKNFIQSDKAYRKLSPMIQEREVDNTARSWISTLPCIEPECAILINKIESYGNIRKDVSIEKRDSISIKYLTMIYKVLKPYI